MTEKIILQTQKSLKFHDFKSPKTHNLGKLIFQIHTFEQIPICFLFKLLTKKWNNK